MTEHAETPGVATTAAAVNPATQTVVYNDSISRWFVGASVVWGLVGMLVGAIIALQMAWWRANLPPLLTFGDFARCTPMRSSLPSSATWRSPASTTRRSAW